MFVTQQDRKPAAGETTDTMRTAVPNVTGIPDQMKAQFEDASGMSFDDVRIHYNSAEPAKLNALAYTQGRNIYLGSGQEKHLPHELGHVIQQKRGEVPVNRWLNGLPLNDDTRLEAEADWLSRYKTPAQVKGFPSNIVQRKMDVEVALVPVEAIYMPLEAKDVMVDTVMLSGRADTGLKNGAGNKTQGDHIIADALVKKYQKVMCRGQILPNIFNFYRNLANEMRYENAIADRCIKNFPEPQRDSQQESRILTSNKKAEEMDEAITWAKSRKKNIPSWRKHIKKIISLYNDAYANSYFATHGESTGGHGEASAMAYIRKTMSVGTSIQPYFVDKLIDTESLKNALMDIGIDDQALEGVFAQMVLKRFHMMLVQMVNYKRRICVPYIEGEEAEEFQEMRAIPADMITKLKYILYFNSDQIINGQGLNAIQQIIELNPYLQGIPREQVSMGMLINKLGTSALDFVKVE